MSEEKKQEDKNQDVVATADSQRVAGYPDIKPGMEVKVHEKIKEINPKGEEKERIQVFQGIVTSRHGRNNKEATITVRKEVGNVVVEKILPVHLPAIDRIEVVKQFQTKKAKLYFINRTKRKLKEVKK